MRLFPFDFAYLDADLKVIEGAALPPGVPLPQFNPQVASALILPFETFLSTGTCAGDWLIVCGEEELEARLAEIAAPAVVAASAVLPDARIAARDSSFSELPKPAAASFAGSQVSLPRFAGLVTRGTGSTLAMTTSWQISTSTMAAVLNETVMPEPVLPEPVEVQEEEAASENLATPDRAVAESEIAELPKEAAASNPLPSPVSDQAAEVADREPVEVDSAPAQSIAPEPEEVTAEPTAVEKKQNAADGSDHAEEPRMDVSDVRLETAPIVEPKMSQVDALDALTVALNLQPKEPAENVPATISRPADADPAKPKTPSGEKKKKDSLGVLVKRFLNCEDPLPERRSIIRLLSQQLVAYLGNREETKPHEVRDVSPTGLYLRTENRWQLGDVVSLVLQRKDAKEGDHESRVIVQVRTVRCDQGGVGLSWVWPQGVEFQPWKHVHTKRSYETDAGYFLRELRLTGALGLLRKICPSAAEEIRLMLHQRLSNRREASAVEITLKAQELLAGREHDTYRLAHPDMVRRILENGSWTEDNWIRQWWAGLLVSSCSADGLDTSNSVFIDLLAKLTPAHLRVLSFACRKDTGLLADSDPAARPDVYCTANELIEAVRSQSLARIQQTMGQLSSLGLLAENRNPSYVAVTEKGKKTRIEPTALALKMHARCNGRQ
jgi:hypothetical protein